MTHTPQPHDAVIFPVDRCPDKANHTPTPDGYMDWVSWAERMKKSHTQVQCPTCRRWAIWIPNTPTTEAVDGE